MDKYQRRARLIGAASVPRRDVPTLVGEPVLFVQDGVLHFPNLGTQLTIKTIGRDAQGLLRAETEYTLSFAAPNGGPIPATNVVSALNALGAVTVGGVQIRKFDASLAKDCLVLRALQTDQVEALAIVGGTAVQSLGLHALPDERATARVGDYAGQTGAQRPVYINRFEDRTSESVNRAVDAVARNVEDVDSRVRAPRFRRGHVTARLQGGRAWVRGQGVWLAGTELRLFEDFNAPTLAQERAAYAQSFGAAIPAAELYAFDEVRGARTVGAIARRTASAQPILSVSDLLGRGMLVETAVDGLVGPAHYQVIANKLQADAAQPQQGLPVISADPWAAHGGLAGTAFGPPVTDVVTFNVLEPLVITHTDNAVLNTLATLRDLGGEFVFVSDQGVFAINYRESYESRYELEPYNGDLSQFFLTDRAVVNAQYLDGSSVTGYFVLGRTLPDELYVSFPLRYAATLEGTDSLIELLVGETQARTLTYSENWAVRTLRAVVGLDPYGDVTPVIRPLKLPTVSLQDVVGAEGLTLLNTRGLIDGTGRQLRTTIMRGGRGAFVGDGTLIDTGFLGSQTRGYAIYTAGGAARRAGAYISHFLEAGTWPAGSELVRDALVLELRKLNGLTNLSEPHPQRNVAATASVLWARYAELLSVLPITAAQRCTYVNAYQGSDATLVGDTEGSFDARDIGRRIAIYFNVGAYVGEIVGVLDAGKRALVVLPEMPATKFRILSDDVLEPAQFSARVYVEPIYGYKSGKHAVVTERRARTYALPNLQIGATAEDTRRDLVLREMHRLVERGDSRAGDRSLDELEVTSLGAEGIRAALTIVSDAVSATEPPVRLNLLTRTSPLAVSSPIAQRSKLGVSVQNTAEVAEYRDNEPITLLACGPLAAKGRYNIDGALHDLLTVGSHQSINMDGAALFTMAMGSYRLRDEVRQIARAFTTQVTDTRVVIAGGEHFTEQSLDLWCADQQSTPNRLLGTTPTTSVMPSSDLLDFFRDVLNATDANFDYYPVPETLYQTMHAIKWQALVDTLLYLLGANVVFVADGTTYDLTDIVALNIEVGSLTIDSLSKLLALDESQINALPASQQLREFVRARMESASISLTRTNTLAPRALYAQMTHVRSAARGGLPAGVGATLTLDSAQAGVPATQRLSNIGDLGIRVGSLLSATHVVDEGTAPYLVTQIPSNVLPPGTYPYAVHKSAAPSTFARVTFNQSINVTVSTGQTFRRVPDVSGVTYAANPGAIGVAQVYAAQGNTCVAWLSNPMDPTRLTPLTPEQWFLATKLSTAPLRVIKLQYTGTLAPTDRETRLALRAVAPDAAHPLTGLCGMYAETRVLSDQVDTTTRTPLANRRINLSVLNGGITSGTDPNSLFSDIGALNINLFDVVGTLSPRQYAAAVRVATNSLSDGVIIRSDTMSNTFNTRYAAALLLDAHAALRVLVRSTYNAREGALANTRSLRATLPTDYNTSDRGANVARQDPTEISVGVAVRGDGALLSVTQTNSRHMPALGNFDAGDVNRAAISENPDAALISGYKTNRLDLDTLPATSDGVVRRTLTDSETRAALYVNGVMKLRGVLRMTGDLIDGPLMQMNVFASRSLAGVYPHINPAVAPRATLYSFPRKPSFRAIMGEDTWSVDAPSGSTAPTLLRVGDTFPFPTSALLGGTESSLIPQLGEQCVVAQNTYTYVTGTIQSSASLGLTAVTHTLVRTATGDPATPYALLFASHVSRDATTDHIHLFLSRPHFEFGDGVIGRTMLLKVSQLGSLTQHVFTATIANVCVARMPEGDYTQALCEYVRVVLAPAGDKSFAQQSPEGVALLSTATDINLADVGPDPALFITTIIHGREWALNAFRATVSDALELIDDAGDVRGTLRGNRDGSLSVQGTGDVVVSSDAELHLNGEDGVFVNGVRVDGALADSPSSVAFYSADLTVQLHRYKYFDRLSPSEYSAHYPTPVEWYYEPGAPATSTDAQMSGAWSAGYSLGAFTPTYRHTQTPTPQAPLQGRIVPEQSVGQAIGRMHVLLPMKLDAHDYLYDVGAGDFISLGGGFESASSVKVVRPVPELGTEDVNRFTVDYTIGSNEELRLQQVARTPIALPTSRLQIVGVQDIHGELIYQHDGDVFTVSVFGTAPLLRYADVPDEFAVPLNYFNLLLTELYVLADADQMTHISTSVQGEEFALRLIKGGALAPWPSNVEWSPLTPQEEQTFEFDWSTDSYKVKIAQSVYGYVINGARSSSNETSTQVLLSPRIGDTYCYTDKRLIRGFDVADADTNTTNVGKITYFETIVSHTHVGTFTDDYADFALSGTVRYIDTSSTNDVMLRTNLSEVPHVWKPYTRYSLYDNRVLPHMTDSARTLIGAYPPIRPMNPVQHPHAALDTQLYLALELPQGAAVQTLSIEEAYPVFPRNAIVYSTLLTTVLPGTSGVQIRQNVLTPSISVDGRRSRRDNRRPPTWYDALAPEIRMLPNRHVAFLEARGVPNNIDSLPREMEPDPAQGTPPTDDTRRHDTSPNAQGWAVTGLPSSYQVFDMSLSVHPDATRLMYDTLVAPNNIPLLDDNKQSLRHFMFTFRITVGIRLQG